MHGLMCTVFKMISAATFVCFVCMGLMHLQDGAYVRAVLFWGGVQAMNLLRAQAACLVTCLYDFFSQGSVLLLCPWQTSHSHSC